MPTYRCINPKNYRLTLDKTYDVLEDLNHSIKIINDNNKVVNYHKSLFTEVITEPIPEPVPEIPVRTEQDLINSITFLNDDNIEEGVDTIVFRDLQNNEVTISDSFTCVDAAISCGILQIRGINQTIANIEEGVDTSEEDLIRLKQEIFITFITRIIQAYANVRYFLLSTNNIPDYEDYHAALDNLCQGSFGWEENPNSGNEIKLWVLNQDIV